MKTYTLIRCTFFPPNIHQGCSHHISECLLSAPLVDLYLISSLWGSVIVLGHCFSLPKSSRVPYTGTQQVKRHLPPSPCHLHVRAICPASKSSIKTWARIELRKCCWRLPEARRPLWGDEAILIVPVLNPGCHILECEIGNNYLLVS